MKTLLFTILLLFTNHSYGAIEANEFDSETQQARYTKLISELRCLVCQNQNLADSNADLAKDLRAKTLSMLKQGSSDKEIRDFMRDRYGDFVLYRPPFSGANAVLWLAPFILLFITLTIVYFSIRKKQGLRNEPNDEAIRNARELLKKD